MRRLHIVGSAKEKTRYSVFVTDEHDIEIMMLKSSALNSFIDEYSSKENIDDFKRHLFRRALDVAYSIGLIKWVNIEKEFNINFKGLNYSEFINVERTEITINIDLFIEILMKRSKCLSESVKKDELIKYVEQYRNKSSCKFQVCCGHDVTNIIALVYRHKWASIENNMNFKKVESSLRLGYQLSHFWKTNLYQELYKKLLSINIQLNDSKEAPIQLENRQLERLMV